MAVTKFVPLAGSRHVALPDSRPAGPVDESQISSITVRTRPAVGTAVLEKQIADMYAQPISQRSYLSRDELGQMQGASAEDLDAVEQYAQEHNLVVSHRSAAERHVVLTGKISDLLRAFPADLYMVHHASGTYRLRRGEILIPAELEEIITGVFGYDTRPKHKA